MRVRVVRDPSVREGAERRQVTSNGVTWWVSPEGVSEAGAAAFEAAWDWLVLHGVNSDELVVHAAIDPAMRSGVPIRFHYRPGLLHMWCHPRHFSQATVNGAAVEHREQTASLIGAG